MIAERRPKIVLLPGLDGSGQFFGGAIKLFEEHGDVIVVSYPVAGSQSYRDLAAWVRDQLPSGEPFVIVAESFSGPIGIEIASNNPVGLEGLLLVASFPSAPLGKLSLLASKAVHLARFLPIPPIASIRWLLLGDDVSDTSKQLRAFLLAQDRSILIERANSALSCDVREKLKQIRVPVLSFVAKQDRLITNGMTAWAEFPNVESVAITGPHFLLQDGDVTELTRSIRHFFECLSA